MDQRSEYAPSQARPDDVSASNYRHNEAIRLPRVNEALPFTPFTSIMPFDPSVIPPPLVNPSIPITPLCDQDAQEIGALLEQLSFGASNAEDASQRCQQTLQDMQNLLDPATLTQYRFKAPKYTWPASHSTNEPSPPIVPQMSRFATMVWETTNVEFLQASGMAARPRAKITKRPIPSTKPPTQIKGVLSIPVVKHVRSEEYTKLAPAPPAPQPALAVIAPLTNAQRAEYQVVPDTAVHSSKEDPGSHEYQVRSNTALKNLQSSLYDIFEAEDSFQADTSGKVARQDSSILSSVDTESGPKLVLGFDWQTRLDSLISKVISSGLFDEVQTDYLARVQRICENGVISAEISNLRIGRDWTDDDFHAWQSRVFATERAFVAARTLLRIMAARPHSKELQSEDYVSAILAALRVVLEDLLIPAVETGFRDKDQTSVASSHIMTERDIASQGRKQIHSLLVAITKVLRMMDMFLTTVPIDESTISKIEAIAKLLIFAENSLSEKDSIIGAQTFENTRRYAMDVLAKIFVGYTGQRQYIIDEILISLEKLPATKQSARQFRIPECKPIQLVSALLMRMVQSSATYHPEPKKNGLDAIESDNAREGQASESGTEDDASYSEDELGQVSRIQSKTSTKQVSKSDLERLVEPLHNIAQSNAAYIIKFLVTRALSTSKSSDEPFRRLLDIFTDDFLEVLGLSNWPAAEILLRMLVSHMIAMAENAKSSASSRVMALELLGTISSGIAHLELSARSAIKGLSNQTTAVAKQLVDAVYQLESEELEFDALVAFNGPYRMIIQHLQSKALDDVQLHSARGYHLMQWAWNFCEKSRRNDASSSQTNSLRSSHDLQDKIQHIIMDPQWLERNHDWPPMDNQEGQLSAIVVTLNSRLCRAFNRIFSILLNSMSSEQPAIRNRGLKSVAALLETDPSILDRNTFVLRHISRCADDTSPLVRASALGLFEKCTSLRPSLDEKVNGKILERTRDTTVSVRKLALNLIKKFYLRNASSDMRSSIANATIARIEDTDDAVHSMAQQTIEEIWFQPLYTFTFDSDDVKVEARLKYSEQASLFIKTTQHGDDVTRVLQALIIQLLTKSKTAKANAKVCRGIIKMLFDGIIDSTEISGAPEQKDILHTLTVFAKASPKLFLPLQLERLEPYTQNLSQSDDFDVYRSTICILRHTLPFQNALKPDFLSSLQTSLMLTVQKLRKAELEEVVSCLWTINTMLGNSERLVNLVRSALAGIWALRNDELKGDPQKVSRISRLMIIVGEFGKVCDFDQDIALFTAKFPEFKGLACSDLLVDKLCPFTSPKQPLAVRERALDAVCTIAQEWPKVYLRTDVVNAFATVFKDQDPLLEEVLLSGLEGFYIQEDPNKGAEDVPELGTGVASGQERLGRTYVATDRDGASTSIAQRFLPQILRLALSSVDEVAFSAARLVVNINKNSLVLPKQSAPALVALETCPNSHIANLAFREHKDQHTKRESLFEKEYMRAIDQVFQYQRDVIKSIDGYVGQPPMSKMHLLWDVLKGGKAQVRKKFLGNMAGKLNFDLSCLELNNGRGHLSYVRFLSENLALFDYDKIEDISHLLTAMEKGFSGTGTATAQAIESEIMRLHIAPGSAPANDTNGVDAVINGDANTLTLPLDRLHVLAVAAQIGSIIWETRTFIRRLWNMQKHMERAKNAKDKDVNKAAARVPNGSHMTEMYLKRISSIMAAADTSDDQMNVCRSFVDTINVDSDVRLAPEEEDEDGDMMNDGSGANGGGYNAGMSENGSVRSRSRSPSAGPGSRPGIKKRRLSSAPGTPRKKNKASPDRRATTVKFAGDFGDEDEEDEEPDDEKDGEWK